MNLELGGNMNVNWIFRCILKCTFRVMVKQLIALGTCFLSPFLDALNLASAWIHDLPQFCLP